MRKDVKRSLFVWPLTAATLLILLCGVALQKDVASRALARHASGFWLSLVSPDGGIHLPTTKEDGRPSVDPTPSVTRASLSDPHPPVEGSADMQIADDQVAATTIGPETQSSQSDKELAAIESWLDVPVDIQPPAIVGIPAPALNSETDLFGFDSVVDTTASRMRPVPAIPATRIQDPVIDLDPKLYPVEQTDRPLVEQSTSPSVELIAPQLAERPTTEEVVSERIAADLRPQPGLSPELQSDLSEQDIPTLEERLFPKRLELDNREPFVADVTEDEEKNAKTRPLAEARSGTWPIASRLLEQLDQLDRVASVSPRENLMRTVSARHQGRETVSTSDLLSWSKNVRQVLQQLPHTKRLGDDQVPTLLNELERSADFAFSHAESIQPRSEQVAWLQAAYSIQRRLSVWRPIYEINSGDYPQTHYVGDDIVGAIAAIRTLQQELVENRRRRRMEPLSASRRSSALFHSRRRWRASRASAKVPFADSLAQLGRFASPMAGRRRRASSRGLDSTLGHGTD